VKGGGRGCVHVVPLSMSREAQLDVVACGRAGSCQCGYGRFLQASKSQQLRPSQPCACFLAGLANLFRYLDAAAQYCQTLKHIHRSPSLQFVRGCPTARSPASETFIRCGELMWRWLRCTDGTT